MKTSQRKLRIVMISLSDFKYLSPAFNEGMVLTQHGCQVDMLTLRNPGEAHSEQLLEGFWVYRENLLTRFLPRRLFFWGLKYIEFSVRLLVSEIPRKASVYVAHNLDTLPAAYILARLKGAKVLYRAHELYAEVEGAAPFWRRVERYLLARVDATIVPNQERAEILYQEYAAPVRPEVVMNCPPYALPIESTLLRDYLAQHGLCDSFIVLFQGRLGSDRCTEELVAAAQYFDEGVSLVLLGPAAPEYLKSIEAQIEQLGLEKKVYIHEAVPYADVLRYTASADLGIVFYSHRDRNNYYCAPNKLFEYFMMGLPVIASDLPGLVRLVGDRSCGVVVDSSDPRAIAQGINSLYSDTDLLSKMRNNALQSAKTYTWEHESQKLLSIYARLLDA